MLPEELSGLPPHRQVQYQVDIMSEAALATSIPYCLTPGRLQELPNQRQELQDMSFIGSSSSFWGAPVIPEKISLSLCAPIIEYVTRRQLGLACLNRELAACRPVARNKFPFGDWLANELSSDGSTRGECY